MKSKFSNKIIEGDCLEGLKKVPDETFDLIIADPPYNLDKNFGVWNESKKKDIWLPWSKQWINECKRVLKNDGSIFIYGIHNYLAFLHVYMLEIDLIYRRQIIWNYENGFSNFKNNLQAHYEPLLWFTKSDRYTFHTIREPYKSEARLKNKITKNGKVWTPHPDGKMAGDVWKFPTLAGARFKNEKVDHPTQKPLSISERIIKHFSNENDLILVPFVGSGSECVAAKKLNRHFFGYELNSKYIKIANERLDTIE